MRCGLISLTASCPLLVEEIWVGMKDCELAFICFEGEVVTELTPDSDFAECREIRALLGLWYF